jgi:serine/threonine-protein kinase
MAIVSTGQIVGAKYELVRFLGRGSMGEVWVARHRGLGEDVALKLLLPSSGPDQVEDPATAAARFRLEARIAARLSRKTRHIVRVTDHGDEGGLPYLVMELLEGQTLDKRLLLRGALPPGEVASIVAQIARALEGAHAEGVVHRDLKPANVFLARDEDGSLLVKLLDFGIARATRTLHTGSMLTTAHGVVFGTPGYMSPEQAFVPKVDSQCDLWALATVAYEALCGELPVPGIDVAGLMANLHDRRIVPVHARNPELPPGLAPFFERAFAAPVERRFQSASELARAFERAIENSYSGVASGAALVRTVPLHGAAPLTSARPGPQTPAPGSRRAWGRLAVAVPAVALAALGVMAAAERSPAESLLAPSPPARNPPEQTVVTSTLIPSVPFQEDPQGPPPPPASESDAGTALRLSPRPRVVERPLSLPTTAAPPAPIRANPQPVPAPPLTPPMPAKVPASPTTVDRSAVL